MSFALLTWVAGSGAQGVNVVALQWDTPTGCPGSDVVLRRVYELSGVLTRSAPMIARGEVSARSSGVHLHLETRDAGQTFVRDVKSPTCEQAAETAALILAMALHAELVVPERPAASVSVTPSNTATSTTPVPPSAPEQPPSAPEQPPSAPELLDSVPGRKIPSATARPPATQPTAVNPSLAEPVVTYHRYLAFSLGGTAAWGVLPGTSWSVTAGAALTFESPWRVEVAGSFAPPQRFALASDMTRGGEFVLWSAGARGCYVVAPPGRGALGLGALACVGGEGGQLRGVGFGTGWSEQGFSPWVAVNGSLSALAAVTERLHVLVRLEALAPLWRDNFVLETSDGVDGRVASPSRIAGRAGAALELTF
jgi:hypothetical protein